MPASLRSAGRRSAAGAALAITLALALGACTGATASNVPNLASSAAGSACLDASTMAIVDQLKANNADVAGILAANKDALIAGLNKMQPSDPAVLAWRDTVVAAIRSDNADAVAAQVALLAKGQVTIPPC